MLRMFVRAVRNHTIELAEIVAGIGIIAIRGLSDGFPDLGSTASITPGSAFVRESNLSNLAPIVGANLIAFGSRRRGRSAVRPL